MVLLWFKVYLIETTVCLLIIETDSSRIVFF